MNNATICALCWELFLKGEGKGKDKGKNVLLPTDILFIIHFFVIVPHLSLLIAFHPVILQCTLTIIRLTHGGVLIEKQMN